MNKIQQLLEQLGSKELATKIIEALGNHEKELRATVEAEAKSRLETAKKVCIEEVEAYKSELARKVQIFFEARQTKIEEQIAKQAAIRESAAEAKLKEITALVEGIKVEGPDNATIQAVKDEVAKAKKLVNQLTEERDVAIRKANRANQIAQKVLLRNRTLEAQMVEAKPAEEQIVSEEKSAEKPAETVAEGKADDKAPVTEAKPAVAKVAVKPAGATPASTRKPLEESLAKQKPAAASAPVSKMAYSPDAIASRMDE